MTPKTEWNYDRWKEAVESGDLKIALAIAEKNLSIRYSNYTIALIAKIKKEGISALPKTAPAPPTVF